MNGINKLPYYLKKYSKSLQQLTYLRFNEYYHCNDLKPQEYVYLCPLCIEQVIGICKDSIHYDQEFTLDHFPPSSVGGKNTTLVCKKCNSNTGTEFDYSLKKWLSIQQVNAKKIGTKFPVNVKFQNTEGNYKGYLIYKGEGQFEYDFPKNYPLVDNWFNKVKNGDRLWKEISISGVNQMHVSRALLKAVYLYCFSVWGYDFVYSITGQNIRSILFNNENHPLSNFGIFYHMDQKMPPLGINYVFKPKNLQVFNVTLPLKSKDSDFFCGVSVLIPGPTLEDWGNLNNYQPLINDNTSIAQNLIKIPEDELNDNFLMPYTDFWNNRSTLQILGEDSN